MDGGTPGTHASWLDACRRATESLKRMFEATPTTAQRAVETGTRGSGGDRTLVIDETAESFVFEELQRMYDEGHRFLAVSEERGEVDFEGSGTRVVIDPIDGSLNARRGLPHYAVSIAVAEGDTMADVVFGYVYDFGPGEEWWASRGGGAFLNGVALDPAASERRAPDGRLEVLGIESADPQWVSEQAATLAGRAYRLRALGAIAVSLCQVADARFDGLISLRSCRAVDAAAGQLIVRESGGFVSFPRFEDPLGAPLDVTPHSPVVSARTAETLAELGSISL